MNILKKQLCNIIININNAKLNKRLYFFIKMDFYIKQILNYLQKHHLIAGYTQLNNLYKVRLCYDHSGNCTIKQIKNYSLKLISVKECYFFIKQYPKTLVLVQTRFGIMDLKTCLQKNCGGLVLASFS